MNQTVLDSSARHALQLIYQLMKSDKTTQLFVHGHTDSQGTEAYNLLLSRKRAQSVKDYLVNRYKIEPHRIFVVGYGESKLAVKNDVTEELKAKNRRVEFESKRIWNGK
ncbi:MAG: OmpA family protein [Bacteroidia bacterium]|nr:OmpA family protein [Bacteroidia bacterium]